MNAAKLMGCIGVLGATAALAAPAFAGTLRWSGNVDDHANIHISGNRVWVDANRNGIRDDRQVVEGVLPDRRVPVRLVQTDGRGKIWVDQTPTRANGGEAVVHIYDSASGFGHYSFVLVWDDNRGPALRDRDDRGVHNDRGYGYPRDDQQDRDFRR